MEVTRLIFWILLYCYIEINHLSAGVAQNAEHR